jgi:nitrogenase molybdenum-iron protein alpha/beta subunit
MFNKIKEFFFPKSKPLVLKKKDEINLKDLEKKTKAQLEKLGRKIGIELDKRLTKDKLIKQIKKATK